MIFALALLGAALAAQQQGPVFRAETKLVEVTATVLDKKSVPAVIEMLQASDTVFYALNPGVGLQYKITAGRWRCYFGAISTASRRRQAERNSS